MANKVASALLILGVAAGAGLVSSPARAQADPAAELDPLAQAASAPADGVALARRQMGSGELIYALATLERVMLMHPDAVEARFLHAGLLCRLDDPDGARSELNQLAGVAISDEIRVEVSAACGDMPRAEAWPEAGRAESGQ